MMRVLGRMVYYYCAARNLKKSAFEEQKREMRKSRKNKSNEGRRKRRRRRKTI
jgi:hypothetical protein